MVEKCLPPWSILGLLLVCPACVSCLSPGREGSALTVQQIHTHTAVASCLYLLCVPLAEQSADQLGMLPRHSEIL